MHAHINGGEYTLFLFPQAMSISKCKCARVAFASVFIILLL